MTPKPKSAMLTFRVTQKSRSQFYAKALRYGHPSEVLREFVEAFIEDRLIIKAPPKKGTIYHES